jgi:putative ABC transport system permease protein
MAVDTLRHDLRIAARHLLRSPGFALVTILTLALGIGANTAIFSVVNAVILRPLPYPDPGQLMFLTTRFPGMGFNQFWVSPPEFFEFREINRSFSSVGAFTTGEANLTAAADRPTRVRVASVTDDLLTALGVRPLQGRLFSPGETDVAGPPPPPGQAGPQPAAVMILSHHFWRSAFGGGPIVGQFVEVNGVRREVIGVLGPGADVMDNRTDIWLPLGLNPGSRQNRGNHFLYLIGRLKSDVTPHQAATELEALVQNWGERVGVKQHVYTPEEHRLQMEPLQEEIVGSARRAIWVLQAAVGFVLLIACANLGNLLLARAETRQREFAVRAALGAGRGRLLRPFMNEGVMLSLVGGALGLLLARAGVQTLVRLYPDSLPLTTNLSVDPVVLLFTLAVSLGTGLVFGLAPLTHMRVNALMSALKDGGARGGTGAARQQVRSSLVVAQIGLAVMLVTGAGLLLRTVYNLTAVDAGFDRSRLVTFQLALPVTRYATPLLRAGSIADHSWHPGGDRHVGPAAQPAGERERHRDRQLHRTSGRPVRECGLLPAGDERLLRDHGHSACGGPELLDGGCCLGGAGGHRQRDAGEDVLERPESNRSAAAALLQSADSMVHRDWRRQRREAGRGRSEDRNRALSLRRSARHARAAGGGGAGHHERRPAHDAAACHAGLDG